MADSSPSAAPKAKGSLIVFALRFIIFFGLSFFLLCLPYKQRPAFYYLHQGTSKIILSLTGTNYYHPTFRLDKMDKAKTEFSAPRKFEKFDANKLLEEKKTQLDEQAESLLEE